MERGLQEEQELPWELLNPSGEAEWAVRSGIWSLGEEGQRRWRRKLSVNLQVVL